MKCPKILVERVLVPFFENKVGSRNFVEDESRIAAAEPYRGWWTLWIPTSWEKKQIFVLILTETSKKLAAVYGWSFVRGHLAQWPTAFFFMGWYVLPFWKVFIPVIPTHKNFVRILWSAEVRTDGPCSEWFFVSKESKTISRHGVENHQKQGDLDDFEVLGAPNWSKFHDIRKPATEKNTLPLLPYSEITRIGSSRFVIFGMLIWPLWISIITADFLRSIW